MTQKARRAKLPLWKKLVYSALVVGAFLICLESLMRACGYGPKLDPAMAVPSPQGQPKLNPFEYFAVCDPYLGFRNRPHGSHRAWYIQGNPLTTTDEYGYRNGFGWPGDEESPIVAFVGDSVTFCSEVNDDQTGPSEVAKLLSEEFDVRVLNAGVRGYSILQAKRALIECLDRFPRIKVAVYTYCGNDLEEAMVPNLRYPAKAPTMLRNPQTGEFQEVEVSDPVVPWGESFFGWQPVVPVPTTRTKVTQWLETRSALIHHCLEGWRRIDLAPFGSLEFPEEGQIVPPADYWKWHDWALGHGANQMVRQLLAEMKDICQSRGAVFVATSFRAGDPLDAVPEFAAQCAAAGVEYVDPGEFFTGKPDSYASLRVDGRYDEHYGPLGTRTYAKALAPALKRILRGVPLTRSRLQQIPDQHKPAD